MTLHEKQALFPILALRLAEYARTVMGAELVGGEWFRSDEQAEIHALGHAGRERLAALVAVEFPNLAVALRNNVGDGIRHSVHTLKLAWDVLLFVGGDYQKGTAAYEPLGRFWEGLSGPGYRCWWGGRIGDGGHFSIEHEGVK